MPGSVYNLIVLSPVYEYKLQLLNKICELQLHIQMKNKQVCIKIGWFQEFNGYLVTHFLFIAAQQDNANNNLLKEHSIQWIH